MALAGPASAATLQTGVGRADITLPTGYYMMGWVRSDAVVKGQNTRLWARVVVLREGRRKVALVAEDLNGIAGGMLQDAARRVRDLGFSEQNVLDSASHTHAAPSDFYNFPTYNTVFMTIDSPTSFNVTGTLDPQLYAFEARRPALAIRRANANLRPAAAGWGHERPTSVTENRSIEAHLADHGIHEALGTGDARQDPDGVVHTIDPEVNIRRVDQLAGRRRVPVGMWSTFAAHGTVNAANFRLYDEDHHGAGAATQVVEAALRRTGWVPARQDVVNVYGNTDEGDQSAGLHRSGTAAADGRPGGGRRDAPGLPAGEGQLRPHRAARLRPARHGGVPGRGRCAVVRARRLGRFAVRAPAGARVTVPRGAARGASGNANGTGLR